MPEGLKVTEVAAAAGQKVKAGDLLAKVDADELDRAVRTQQAQVQKQQLALDALREQKPVDSGGVDAAQTALSTAQADRDKANSRACQLIREGKYRIYEISYMLSFENAYYFTRVFRRHVGMTPTEYQRSLRPDSET